MLTKILVLCAGIAISVVTANPLLQAIVSQSCPICEQNSLKGQIQNLLLQSIQPYAQTYFSPNPPGPVQPSPPVQQPCSLCPPQNRQNQNFQSPPYQQVVNQPYCPRSQPVQPQNSNFVPEAVNKLLSNANLRNILDPNTKLVNQNGVEVLRNGACNSGTPNVVNNYIIVPPDFLLEDNISDPKGNKKIPAERKVKHRNDNINNRTELKTEINSEVAPDNSKVADSSPDNGKRKQRRRQRNRSPDIKVKVVQENSTHETNQIESPQPMEQINIQNKQLPTEINNNNNNATTIPSAKVTGKVVEEKQNLQTTRTENIPVTNINVKPVQNIAHYGPTEKLNSQQSEDTSVKNVKETSTVKSNAHKNLAKTKGKKIATRHFNAREEAVINDFRQKFPNIPEDVVKNLIDHMKRQLQQHNFNNPAFYYPQFPISYDQLFRNQFSQTPTIVVSSQGKKSNLRPQKPIADDQNQINNDTSRSNKRRKNRRNKNQQAPHKSSTPETYTTTTESTPVIVLPISDKNCINTTTKPTMITTEEPVSTKIATETVTEAVVKKQNDNVQTSTAKFIEKSKKPENIETKNIVDNKVPTQDSEEIVPNVYINELTDEYYPDFTGDHQYYSNEDFSFIVLEDDRFHYTTDKNIELEELNRERRRFDSNSRKNVRRPEGRYIMRLKNKDKTRSITRQNNRDQKSQSKISESTGLRSGINTKTEIPRIVVKIKPEDTKDPAAYEDTDFVEWNFKKPTTLSGEREIEFRTPPTLENIDFETKQVNKKHNSYDETKISSYSDFKTPQYNYNKYDDMFKNVDNNNKPKPQIETVYANSKVATYGKQPSSSIEVSTEKDIWMDIDKEYSRIENDGRKVVFAKSIDGDFW